MTVFWAIGLGLVFCFGLVVFFGAPYLPTLKKQTEEALELLDLKPGQILLELGSGDGRVLRAAAEEGIYAIGYELNPLLVAYSYFRHFKYRRLISLKWTNFWYSSLPESDGIYTFLHTRFMKKLDKKISHESTKPIKLVSYAFEVPGRKPQKTLGGLYLYSYQPLARASKVK